MSDDPGATPITVETTQGALIVRLKIKLIDDNALKNLMRVIEEASKANGTTSLIILDLSSVVVFPSLALGLLVQIQNACRARQQRLKLAGVQPQVRQVFAI